MLQGVQMEENGEVAKWLLDQEHCLPMHHNLWLMCVMDGCTALERCVCEQRVWSLMGRYCTWHWKSQWPMGHGTFYGQWLYHIFNEQKKCFCIHYIHTWSDSVLTITSAKVRNSIGSFETDNTGNVVTPWRQACCVVVLMWHNLISMVCHNVRLCNIVWFCILIPPTHSMFV